MEQWIAVRTKPNREAWAGENIFRQGYKFYLPRFKERVISKKTRRLEWVVRPLFPGYIFVFTPGPWRWLTGTFGVSTVVCVGDTPAPLPKGTVEKIKRGEGDDGYIILPGTPRPSKFRPGQLVRITEGPFQGYEGAVDEQFFGLHQGSTSQQRIGVLLNLLGRRTPVLVGEESLETAA